MSLGSRIGFPERSSSAHSGIRSSSTIEPPTSWPAAAKKVNAIPPPTTSASTWRRRALSTPSLSATLAPPTTATNGRSGDPSSTPSASISRLQEEAGGAGQAGGRTDDGCVAAMGDAEGVVDIGVVAVDQLLDEGGVVVLLARVEAQVLAELAPGGRGGPVRRGPAPRSQRGSGAPLGRPRWVQAVTVAPRSIRYSMVGRAARMRKSSVTMAGASAHGRRGTLKSTRTSTLAPSRSGRSPSSGNPPSSGLSDSPLMTWSPLVPVHCSRSAPQEPAPLTTSERSTSRLAYPHSLSYQPSPSPT